VDEYTATELEEMQLQKRREDGTPCTMETFLAWKERYDREIEEKKEEEENEERTTKKKSVKVIDEKEGRLTGFDFFSSKAGMNLEALEAAAEEAGNDETALEDEDYDEDLFIEDDVDLDDLDFDDDSEEDDDDELDI
jgi:hypothetical protein